MDAASHSIDKLEIILKFRVVLIHFDFNLYTLGFFHLHSVSCSHFSTQCFSTCAENTEKRMIRIHIVGLLSHQIIRIYNHCKKYIHSLSKSLRPKLPFRSLFKNCNFPNGPLYQYKFPHGSRAADHFKSIDSLS